MESIDDHMLLAAGILVGAYALIFTDDFEEGNTSAWSLTVEQ